LQKIDSWGFLGAKLIRGIFLVELEDQGVCDPPHTQDGKNFELELDINSYDLCILQHISQYNYGP